jgi:hypothetical protein
MKTNETKPTVLILDNLPVSDRQFTVHGFLEDFETTPDDARNASEKKQKPKPK